MTEIRLMTDSPDLQSDYLNFLLSSIIGGNLLHKSLFASSCFFPSVIAASDFLPENHYSITEE